MTLLTSLLQAIGLVFSCMLIVVMTLISFYFSYILGIGLLLIGGTIVVTYLLHYIKSGT